MQLAPRQLDLFRRALAAPAEAGPAPLPLLALAEAPPTAAVAARALPPLDVEAARPSRAEALARSRALAHRLAERLGTAFKVLLTVHDNRSTMVSFRRQPPLLRLRLHHMFLDAPDAVVAALVEYAAHGRRDAGQVLDEFIAAQQSRIRAQRAGKTSVEPRGRCFDLQLLFDQLNERYFQGGIRASIGWGRNTSRRRRKSIRLGVYDHKAREIRLHPALDKPDVPRFFVEFIVFHEMLHQLFPSQRAQGRHVHHPRAFRDREKAFPHYQAALNWEKEHLNALLRR